MRPPMVAVVGRKHSGKTTLVVRLCAELSRRGHRVMTIKHGSHTFNIDPATTDTYRHYHEGGAERVAMVSPDKFALVARWSEEPSPQEIAERHMADADVVVCEGFKASDLPKIEVVRRAAHPTSLLEAGAIDAARYIAVATDDAALEIAGVEVVQLDAPDAVARLADVVERRVIAAHRSA